MGILTWTAVYGTCKHRQAWLDHRRVRSGILNAPFDTSQAQNSAGIGVISMAMAATNMLDNKALALPNVKNRVGY